MSTNIIDLVTERIEKRSAPINLDAEESNVVGYTLRDFTKACGDRLLDALAVKQLLGDPASHLLAGEKPHDHPLYEQQRKVGSYWESGVGAAKLVGEILRTKTPYALSEIAVALIECKLSDYADADPAGKLNPMAANKLLGIPKTLITDEFGNTELPIQTVVDWATRNQAPSELSISALRKIVTVRRLRLIEDQQAKQDSERPRTLIESAIQARLELETQQEAERKAERRRSFSAYREILLRRDTPSDNDVVQLAYLMSDLGISDSDLKNHIGLFETVEQLEKLATATDEVRAEVNTKKALFDELTEAIKKHDIAKREFLDSMSRLNRVTQAPLEIRSLKESYSELFGGDA